MESELNDVVSALCYGNERDELEEYYSLALKCMEKFDDPVINRYITQMMSPYADDIIKRIAFFIVLNIDTWLKGFVCDEKNSFRGFRAAMNPEKREHFFKALSIACEDYMNGQLTEDTMMNRIRNAYMGIEEQMETNISTTANGTRKSKSKKRRTGTKNRRKTQLTVEQVVAGQ